MASEKLERILKLLAELLNSSTPRTAEELRSKIKMYPDDLVAFRRQFNRDKSALKEMGVPLEVIPVGTSERTAEAYFVDNKAYYLPDLGLTDDELSQLNFAANSIHLIGQISEEEALRKLGGYSQQTPASGTTTSFSASSILGDLFEALSTRQTVSFVYTEKSRTLEPHLLQFKGEHWYLTGRETQSNRVKSFRTDRIAELIINDNTEDYATPEALTGANFDAISYGDDDPVTAKVIIDKSHIDWVENNLDIKVKINDTGQGIAQFSVKNYDAFINRVLLLLDHAEIIEPEFLKMKLINRLRIIQRNYKESHA